MIATAELAAQRKLTEAFIACDRTPIALVRNTKVDDGSGGYTLVPATIAVQQFRLLPQQDVSREVQTADGRMVRPNWVLLGKYNADMVRGDTFTMNGDRLELAQVEDKQYEMKGWVIYHGR